MKFRLLAVLVMMTMATAMACEYGCTPGYWKNHPTEAVWGPTGYTPNQMLEEVFVGVNWGAIGIDGEDTLLQALNYGGGSGVPGAAKILLRAAVAALLNAAHPAIAARHADPHNGGTTWVITRTVGYLNHTEGVEGYSYRASILSMASYFDTENNRGCPIDAFGRVMPK